MQRFALADIALKRPITVAMTLVAVVLVGTIGVFRLPLAFLPSESASRIEVEIDGSRISPEIAEREIVRPFEEAVAGLRDLRSMSIRAGYRGVDAELELAPGTDIDERKLELRERLDRLRGRLPDTVEDISISSSAGARDEPMMVLRIASDRKLEQQYYLLQNRIVRPLERVDGVARIELHGAQPHRIEIAVDLDAVERAGASFPDLRRAVRGAHQSRGLGVLRGASQSMGVRTLGGAASVAAYASIPVQRAARLSGAGPAASPAGSGGSTQVAATNPEEAGAPDPSLATLGQLATLVKRPRERRGGSRLDGRPAIGMSIYASAGAGVVDVSRRVRKTLETVRQDPELGDVHVIVFRDQGEVVLETLADLRDTGLYGGAIGLLVLFAFLRRTTNTFIAALCIPISVLATCGVLFLRGGELNCIVLLGLVLGVGMLVDNAVVIVEAIHLQRQRGAAPMAAAREGAREVGLATIASTLSSVIVFLPLIVSGPEEPLSAYLRPLGITFVIALLASLLVSQTLVPLLSGRFGGSGNRPARHTILGPLSRAYGSVVARTICYPRLALLIGLAIAATTWIPLRGLKIEMGTERKSISIPIRIDIQGDATLEGIVAEVLALEQAVLPRKKELGLKALTCRYRSWWAYCQVYPEQIENEAQMSTLQARLSRLLPERLGVEYHLGDSGRRWWRNRDPRVIRFAVRGEDMGVVAQLTQELYQHLKQVLARGDANDPDAGGYDRIEGPFNEGGRELFLHLRPQRLQALGLRADQVASAVSLAFQGVPAGRVHAQEGEIAVRLTTGRLTERGPELRALEQFQVPLPRGGHVPLRSLAHTELRRAPWWTQREDRQTELRMSVRFFGSDRRANRKAVFDAIEGFDFPPGYSAGAATARWERKEKRSETEMLVNLVLCLVLVYAVMASLFESFLQPMGILITCLLGALGAPWAMWATGTTLDTVAVVGLFILVGIVVNNGIMLVDKITQLRATGMPRSEAVRRAGQDRLRPILMTAATTVLGLVPMLLHHPTLAGVYYHSIAIIIAGGLLTSTFITLLFLPATYVVFEDLARETRGVWRRVAGGSVSTNGSDRSW